MNINLLSALSFVSADDYLQLPIFRKTTNVTIEASGGSNGVTFRRESLYANVTINDVSYTTHLEPVGGDLWIFEDAFNQTNRRHAPTEENLQRLGFKWDLGMYYIDQVKFDRAQSDLAYAVINRALAVDNSRIGGLGLGPKNSPIFEYPMANGDSRDDYENFADYIKAVWTNSDVFTINLAADSSSEDKLVYGAMDLSRFTGKLKYLLQSLSTSLIDADFVIYGIKTSAALDIEDPNTYLDDKVVAAIAKKFGAEWDDSHSLYTLPAMPQKGLILDFDGLEIRVPPADVWVQDKQVDEKWYFTVRPVTSFSQLPKGATIGADILKSIYIVYDLGHDRAAIGKATRNPGPAKYVAIPQKGIPEKYLL